MCRRIRPKPTFTFNVQLCSTYTCIYAFTRPSISSSPSSLSRQQSNVLKSSLIHTRFYWWPVVPQNYIKITRLNIRWLVGSSNPRCLTSTWPRLRTSWHWWLLRASTNANGSSQISHSTSLSATCATRLNVDTYDLAHLSHWYLLRLPLLRKKNTCDGTVSTQLLLSKVNWCIRDPVNCVNNVMY